VNRHRIYVASSWRNALQPLVVSVLRRDGHQVYDFRNPETAAGAFAWSDLGIGDDWTKWGTTQSIEALEHPIAKGGFASDWTALTRATLGVLVGPCGRSAHLELGVMVGRGIPTAILLTEPQEAELMYGMVDLVTESVQRLALWASGSPVWQNLREDGPRDILGNRVKHLRELL
jgi:hypothetical protein